MSGYSSTINTAFQAFSVETEIGAINAEKDSTICDIFFANLDTDCEIIDTARIPFPADGKNVAPADLNAVVDNTDETLLNRFTVEAAKTDTLGTLIRTRKGFDFYQLTDFAITGTILNWTCENYQAFREYEHGGRKVGLYYSTESCCLFTGDSEPDPNPTHLRAIVGTLRVTMPLDIDGTKGIPFTFVWKNRKSPNVYEITDCVGC